MRFFIIESNGFNNEIEYYKLNKSYLFLYNLRYSIFFYFHSFIFFNTIAKKNLM